MSLSSRSGAGHDPDAALSRGEPLGGPGASPARRSDRHDPGRPTWGSNRGLRRCQSSVAPCAAPGEILAGERSAHPRHADCRTHQRAAPEHDPACVTRADHDPLDGSALRRGGWEDGPATWNPARAAPTARWRDRASGGWMVHDSPDPCGVRNEKGMGPASTQQSLAGPSLVSGKSGRVRRGRLGPNTGARGLNTPARAGSPWAGHGTRAGAGARDRSDCAASARPPLLSGTPTAPRT